MERVARAGFIESADLSYQKFLYCLSESLSLQGLFTWANHALRINIGS